MIFKNRSIFTSLFLQYILLVTILGTIFFSISYNILEKNYLANLTEKLIGNAAIIEDYIAGDIKENRRDSFDRKVQSLSEKLDIRVTVISPQGEVIIDSEENYRLMDNHMFRPEIESALKKGSGSSTRFSKTLKLKMLYVAYLSKNGSEKFIIRLSMKVKDINDITADYRSRFIVISATLIFFTLIFAFFMSLNFIKPIRVLSQLSRKVANGELNVKTVTTKNESSEIFNLNRSFNEMTERLRELFSKLKKEKDEVKSIISSISEGILVIDNENRVIRSNDSFYEMFKTEPLKRYYWEVLREPEIINFLNSFQQGNHKSVNREIAFSEKTLLCSITYLKSRQGFVVLFSDISEIKRLESMKRDFISNVSHELRTPLTAIKGFTETLIMDEQDEGKVKYLNIIHRHNERLINIVKDLLVLSELEKSGNSRTPWHNLVIEKIEIRAMVNRVVELLKEKMEKKGLKLVITVEEGLLNFEGDAFKIEQLLINLISNGIKYSDRGRLELEVKSSGKNIVIIVKDEGIGIPPGDLERIFERFYVVDKSRSKKSGGTGLGLSIVKHVAILHKGDIKVESRQNAGTSFIITLPRIQED